MGMNVGNSSSDEPEVMMEMNTTPLIDVMLVLLVMLIITIPIQLHAVNMNMPIGNPPPKVKEPVVVKLNVDEKSDIYWNGEKVTLTVLDAKMSEAAALGDQPEVHLDPDKAAKYDVVASVLAMSQRRGLTKIGIIGRSLFIQ
jgi:biopolymer transport protein ExbD